MFTATGSDVMSQVLPLYFVSQNKVINLSEHSVA